MDTFEELIAAVQSDLTLGDESSFITPTTIKLALNRAYRHKVAGLFRWPRLKDALKTSSENGLEYYDYPQNWKPESVWKLKVDGVDYKAPLAFSDYEFEKDNDFPSGNTKIWANEDTRYFITPTPTTDGDNNIEIYGFRVPDLLVSNSDTTIFSYNTPELNEAIVLEAKAILKGKAEDDKGGQFASIEAKQICLTVWNKLKMQQAKLIRTVPRFNVPDMFGRPSSKQVTGNFE